MNSMTDETPLMSSDERPHILDSDCWCNPTVEYVEGKRRHHGRDATP